MGEQLPGRQSCVLFKFHKNPASPNYHMSIKKSEVILKRFIDLKISAWFTLSSEKKKHVLWHLKLFSVQLPVKVFKIHRIFSICQIYWEYRAAGSFSILKTLTKGKDTYKTRVLPTCLVEFPSSKDIKRENK